jgi:hypothetical protein
VGLRPGLDAVEKGEISCPFRALLVQLELTILLVLWRNRGNYENLIHCPDRDTNFGPPNAKHECYHSVITLGTQMKKGRLTL